MARLNDEVGDYLVEHAQGFGEWGGDGGRGGVIGCRRVCLVRVGAGDRGEIFFRGSIRERVGDVRVDGCAGAVEEGAKFVGEVETRFVSAGAGARFHLASFGTGL